MARASVSRVLETGTLAAVLSLVLAGTGLALSPTVNTYLGVGVDAFTANILYIVHLVSAVLLVGFVAWHLVPPLQAFARKVGQSLASYVVALVLLALLIVEIVTGYELYAHDYRIFTKSAAVYTHLVVTFALLALLGVHAWRGLVVWRERRAALRSAYERAVEAGKEDDALRAQASVSRRAFLRMTAYAALGLALAYAIGSSASHELRAWRLNSVGATPRLEKDTWRLRITGLVNKPVEITFDQLTAMQDKRLEITHHCVEGWTYTDEFTGVPLADVLALAGGVKPGARMLIFKTPEVSSQYFAFGQKYTTNFPYTEDAARNALVVYAVGGEDLPREHGFPVRLMTPKKWGYKACKWLTEIEVSADSEYRGYWEQNSYHNTGDYPGPIFE